MAISSSLILKAFIDRMKANPTINALVSGRIFSNVDQDSNLPYIRCIISNANDDGSDKTFSTITFTVEIDIWSNYRGQLQALDIGDLVRDEFDQTQLSGTSGQSLSLSFDSYDMDVESDGQTHHQNLLFTYIEVDNG